MSIAEYKDLSVICIGTMLGTIYSAQSHLRYTTLLLSGVADLAKVKTDRYSGVTYHVFGGLFFGRRKLDPLIYRSQKMVLPPAADAVLIDAFETTYAPLRFRLLLELIDSAHSSGFDWRVKFKKENIE